MLRTKRSALVLLAAALLAAPLAGCASRSSRIEAALVKAGVSQRMAACLAPRLAERLSDEQLRTLAHAAHRAPGETGKVDTGEIVARVAGTGDARIVETVSSAGLHCALR